MKVHYPKLYNMAHLLSLNVSTASKGSNNYILFNPSAGADEALRPFSFFLNNNFNSFSHSNA